MKRTVIQCVRQILEDAMARCCEAVCIQTSELLRSRHGYQQSKLGHTAVAESVAAQGKGKDRREPRVRAMETARTAVLRDNTMVHVESGSRTPSWPQKLTNG